jgi:hypothetical protein
LILGGAAVHRCGNCPILSKALAAEVVAFAQKPLFPQAAKGVSDFRTNQGIAEAIPLDY